MSRGRKLHAIQKVQEFLELPSLFREHILRQCGVWEGTGLVNQRLALVRIMQEDRLEQFLDLMEQVLHTIENPC